MDNTMPMRVYSSADAILNPIPQRAIQRDVSAREPRGQRLAVDVLQHQEFFPSRHHVVERADGTRELRDDPSLPARSEPEDHSRSAGEARLLHGDCAIQVRVARPIDLAHAARADLKRLDAYAPKPGAAVRVRGREAASPNEPAYVALPPSH